MKEFFDIVASILGYISYIILGGIIFFGSVFIQEVHALWIEYVKPDVVARLQARLEKTQQQKK